MLFRSVTVGKFSWFSLKHCSMVVVSFQGTPLRQLYASGNALRDKS